MKDIYGNEIVECSNCHSYHDGLTLPSLEEGQSCPIPMGLPCICCHEPVTVLSMVGNKMCTYCGIGGCWKKKKTSFCDSQILRLVDYKVMFNSVLEGLLVV